MSEVNIYQIVCNDRAIYGLNKLDGKVYVWDTVKAVWELYVSPSYPARKAAGLSND